MTVQFEEPVLPSTKIVNYSDVIYTIPSEQAIDAARERIERFTPVCLATAGSSPEVKGVVDQQSGAPQRNGFANRASCG